MNGKTDYLKVVTFLHILSSPSLPPSTGFLDTTDNFLVQQSAQENPFNGTGKFHHRVSLTSVMSHFNQFYIRNNRYPSINFNTTTRNCSVSKVKAMDWMNGVRFPKVTWVYPFMTMSISVLDLVTLLLNW